MASFLWLAHSLEGHQLIGALAQCGRSSFFKNRIIHLLTLYGSTPKNNHVSRHSYCSSQPVQPHFRRASLHNGCQAPMGDSVRDSDLPAGCPVADLKPVTIDDDLGPRRAGRASLPSKPRRYFLPGLVVCIIARLEMFHRVSLDLQCSKPGIEVRRLISPWSSGPS